VFFKKLKVADEFRQVNCLIGYVAFMNQRH